MCLEITEDSKRLTRNLRRRKKPIIAYKILSPDMESGYYSFQWTFGLNISDRRSIELLEDEIWHSKINKGFHLALEKPEKCPYQPQCYYHCQYRCLYLYQCYYRHTKVFKCEIDPKDVVSAGEWLQIPSIIAIKVTLLEEVKDEEEN